MPYSPHTTDLPPENGKDLGPLCPTRVYTQHLNPLLILTFQTVAFWPVWQWYIARVTDGSDEPWGVVALATALLFLLGRGRPARVNPLALVTSSVVVFLYIVSFSVAPALLRAALAVFSLSLIVSGFYLGRSVHLGILGLLLLSLPLIASLQFYLGYPLRLVTAEISARLITLTGYSVTAEGTCLRWLGDLISVDAPCSGIKMLWTGLYLNFTLACFRSLGTVQTWLTYSLSMFTIFVGNLLRTTALFYSEAHIVVLPSWGHQGIGIFAFFFVALGIVAIHKQVHGEQQCA